MSYFFKNKLRKIILLVVACLIIFFPFSCTDKVEIQHINRFELVNRHNVVLNHIDTLGSLSVGNGDFAYTADITGMQTFPEAYERGVSLGTQSNWGWHSFPNDSNYSIDDVLVTYESCNEKSVPYAVQHKSGRAARASNWLRSNPHRLHLGIIGLNIINSKDEEIQLADILNPKQTLNLWTGKIESYFEVDGIPVRVETVSHQERDMVSFRINSPLIEAKRLKIKMKFPYGKDCHTCPGYDWSSSEKHSSEIFDQQKNKARIKRSLDTTNYFVDVSWAGKAQIRQPEQHHFEIAPAGDQQQFDFSISFYAENTKDSPSTFEQTELNSKQNWEAFWMSGGALYFSDCTDPRAHELERRVVLSQYLTKIQCSGSLPPQETGLTFNSWYGKFHLEMHWWHAVHFALWGRPQYLENSLTWYFNNLENARVTAHRQGYEGVRWQKMTSPEGLSSPSNVGEFLVWQQPHIIYFSELLYRSNPTNEILLKYQNLVFETAEFMASFARQNEHDGYFHLCPPLIPAQEHFKATETSDPAFELSYWYWGLKTAQKWRERLGLAPNDKWQLVIDNLAPIPADENHYLPTAEAADAFSNFDKRRDHPIVIGSYGLLPNERIDVAKMSTTFDDVMRGWNWQSTWGWDYPLLALTATRLLKPDDALDALFTDTQKNTYLINGHNYQDGRLRIYLPGNGGLLAAVAMMSAGFEGSNVKNPGFPKNGKWEVKWEGLQPIF